MKILISACLLGESCRYDGKSKCDENINAQKNNYEFLPVCPECLGGLGIPRDPSEIIGNRVVSENGKDVTENYATGARKTLEIAVENDIKIAILKERSPSCGYGKIYDGTFTGKLTDGNGITAQLLSDNGIVVLGESKFCSVENVIHKIYGENK